MSEEKFSLKANPKDNYVNLILNDMKSYNDRKNAGDLYHAVRALQSLISDLPPPAKELLKDEAQRITDYFEKSSGAIPYYSSAELIYNKVVSWVWPNMLQEYFNAKPRNPQPTTLGE